MAIDDVNPIWLKTPAARIVASHMEGVEIEIERILDTFYVLQKRVEYVIVEGVGGWLVPIRADSYVATSQLQWSWPY